MLYPPYRHRPIYGRASFDQPCANIGLAIGPPRPALNLESKRLRGPDAPPPKPSRDLFRNIMVVSAQLNALTRWMSAVMVPVLAPLIKFSQRLEAMKKQMVLRPPTLHK